MVRKEVKFKDYTHNVYYIFLISAKSYKYISFASKEEMNRELNVSHSATNIIKLVLTTISEDFTFYSGVLEDEQFDFIQKQIKESFGQDINRLTSKAADLSDNFEKFMQNKGQ